jgi:putative transposase
MGSVGDAYDNAMAESVFANLECELIDRRSLRTKTEARLAVFTWSEAWYNTRRRYSALGRISPLGFERRRSASLTNPTAPPRTGLPTAGAWVAVATPAVDNPTLRHC